MTDKAPPWSALDDNLVAVRSHLASAQEALKRAEVEATALRERAERAEEGE